MAPESIWRQRQLLPARRAGQAILSRTALGFLDMGEPPYIRTLGWAEERLTVLEARLDTRLTDS